MKPIQTKNLIAVDEYCLHAHVEYSFVTSLEQSGLLELMVLQERSYIEADQLLHLEKMARFHYDWDINMEGLETITHLLQKINKLYEETVLLKNQLRFYE
jgi:chaperone modulatory protein CbpM